MNTTEQKTVETLAAFKVLGTADEVTSCDCCGRKNLKETVALLPEGEDQPVHFGVTCAAKAMKQTVKYVRDALTAVQAAKRAEVQAAERAQFSAYCSWLSATYGVKGPADLFATNVSPAEALKRYRATK